MRDMYACGAHGREVALPFLVRSLRASSLPPSVTPSLPPSLLPPLPPSSPLSVTSITNFFLLPVCVRACVCVRIADSKATIDFVGWGGLDAAAATDTPAAPSSSSSAAAAAAPAAAAAEADDGSFDLAAEIDALPAQPAGSAASSSEPDVDADEEDVEA